MRLLDKGVLGGRPLDRLDLVDIFWLIENNVIYYFILPFITPIQRTIEAIRHAKDTMLPMIGIAVAISLAILLGGGEKYFVTFLMGDLLIFVSRSFTHTVAKISYSILILVINHQISFSLSSSTSFL